MIINISLILIAIAAILTFTRFLLGPRKEDRMVAIDSGTTVTAILLVLLSYIFKRSILIDVALVYAVLAFIAVIIGTKYLKKEL